MGFYFQSPKHKLILRIPLGSSVGTDIRTGDWAFIGWNRFKEGYKGEYSLRRHEDQILTEKGKFMFWSLQEKSNRITLKLISRSIYVQIKNTKVTKEGGTIWYEVLDDISFAGAKAVKFDI